MFKKKTAQNTGRSMSGSILHCLMDGLDDLVVSFFIFNFYSCEKGDVYRFDVIQNV